MCRVIVASHLLNSLSDCAVRPVNSPGGISGPGSSKSTKLREANAITLLEKEKIMMPHKRIYSKL